MYDFYLYYKYILPVYNFTNYSFIFPPIDIANANIRM